jgi:hypothetical protein
MTFLCGSCHFKKTKKQLSIETIEKAKLNPAATREGYSFEAFDVGDQAPIVRFGPMSASDCKCLIEVFREPILWIKAPEEPGGPFRLNANFYDKFGNHSLSIFGWQFSNDPKVIYFNMGVAAMGANLRAGAVRRPP